MNILTPYGWVPDYLLKVGDEVLTVDDVRQERLSAVCRPLLLSNLVTDETYRVQLSTGDYLDGFLDSRFEVRVGKEDWSIKTLRDILDWFPPMSRPEGSYCLCSTRPYLNNRYEVRQLDYYVPLAKQNLEDLPPYWLGVFASIGCLDNIEPYVYLDSELAQRMRDQGTYKFFLEEPRERLDDQERLKYTFKSYLEIANRSKLSLELENLGLLGKRVEDRRIHPSYLFTDFYDRVNLINGVMDSIGYVDPLDGLAKIRPTSWGLTKDLEFLLRSLGGYFYHERSGTLVVFMPNPELPFTKPSKASQYIPTRPTKSSLYIESIDLLGTRDIRNLSAGDNVGIVTDNFYILYSLNL